MIIKELYQINEEGLKLYKTYSDKNYYIIQNETGIQYASAVDIETANYTYSESDEYVDGGNTEITGDEMLSMLEEVL